MKGAWRRTATFGATIVAAVAVALYLGLFAGHRAEEPSIYQRGSWIVVENPTKMDWIDVQVTINAYYRGISPKLSAGGRLEAPLNGFTTGLGQRFNPAREHVMHVEVRATNNAGQPVSITWPDNNDKGK